MLTQTITGWNEQPVRDVMLHAIPDLRAFAISLSGKVDRADDLVQETLLRPWQTSVRFSRERTCPLG